MSQAFVFIWQYMKKHIARIAGIYLATFMIIAIAIYKPKLTGVIVDEIIQPMKLKLATVGNVNIITDDQWQLMIWLSVWIVGLTLGRSLIIVIKKLASEDISQSIVNKIRLDMYKKLCTLDFDYFDKTRTGDIMTRMSSDVEMIRHFTASTIYAGVEHALTFIVAIIFMFFISVPLTLTLLVVTPFVAFIAFRLSKEARPNFQNMRQQFAQLNAAVQENIGGNRVVKAFAKEDYEISKFSKRNEHYKEANIKVSRIWAKYMPPLELLSAMLSVFLVMIGGTLVIWGKVSIGDIVTFSMLLWTLNNPMRMSGWIIAEIERFIASAERIQELLDTESFINTHPQKVEKDAFKGVVEFNHVCFQYGDEPVLTDINMKVEAGQVVAIVGPTGSGKSTLINLICRFYDVSSGKVSIDGIDVKKISLKNLRENIATAMQDIFLFSDTIEGNIAFGTPDASMEEVRRVARVADAHGFIASMPEGYDTIIGERGVGLSGGQKQRIALARALIKDPSILILDDTTSSVDMETEHEIHKTMKEYFHGRTTFIIAHRISSVKHADQIFVISDGQILENGTHEDLINRPIEEAYYRNVFENQLGDFDNFYAKGGERNGTK
ncbi:MAG: ABC transporter ATP-binding protein [Hyphomonadaceae bacterium]|nr:ABC transporter ATP-binding protein [Clostridia bacterium]